MNFWTLDPSQHTIPATVGGVEHCFTVPILLGVHLARSSDQFAELLTYSTKGESLAVLVGLLLRFARALHHIRRLVQSHAALVRLACQPHVADDDAAAEEEEDERRAPRPTARHSESNSLWVQLSMGQLDDDALRKTLATTIATTTDSSAPSRDLDRLVEAELAAHTPDAGPATPPPSVRQLAAAMCLNLYVETFVDSDVKIPVPDAVLGYRIVLTVGGFSKAAIDAAWTMACSAGFEKPEGGTRRRGGGGGGGGGDSTWLNDIAVQDIVGTATNAWRRVMNDRGALLQHTGNVLGTAQLSAKVNVNQLPEVIYNAAVQAACVLAPCAPSLWSEQFEMYPVRGQLTWAARHLVQELSLQDSLTFFSFIMPHVQLVRMFHVVNAQALLREAKNDDATIADRKSSSERTTDAVQAFAQQHAADPIVAMLNQWIQYVAHDDDDGDDDDGDDRRKIRLESLRHVDWLTRLHEFYAPSSSTDANGSAAVATDRYARTPYGPIRQAHWRMRVIMARLEGKLPDTLQCTIERAMRGLLFTYYLRTRVHYDHPGQSMSGSAILRFIHDENVYVTTSTTHGAAWRVPMPRDGASLFSTFAEQRMRAYRFVFFMSQGMFRMELLTLARYAAYDTETKATSFFFLSHSPQGGTSKSFESELVEELSVPGATRTATAESLKFLAQSARHNFGDSHVVYDELPPNKLTPSRHDDGQAHQQWKTEVSRGLLDFWNLAMHPITGERTTEHHTVLSRNTAVANTNEEAELAKLPHATRDRIVLLPHNTQPERGAPTASEAELARGRHESHAYRTMWRRFLHAEQCFMFEFYKLRACGALVETECYVGTILWPLIEQQLRSLVGYIDKKARGQLILFDMARTLCALEVFYALYRVDGASPYAGEAHEWDEVRLDWFNRMLIMRRSHLVEALVLLMPNWWDPLEPRFLAAIWLLYREEVQAAVDRKKSIFQHQEGSEYLYITNFRGRGGTTLASAIEARLHGDMRVTTAALDMVMQRWSETSHVGDASYYWHGGDAQTPHVGWHRTPLAAGQRVSVMRARVDMRSQRAVSWAFLKAHGERLVEALMRREYDQPVATYEADVLRRILQQVFSHRHQRGGRFVVGPRMTPQHHLHRVDIHVDGTDPTLASLKLTNPMGRTCNVDDLRACGMSSQAIDDYLADEAITCELDFAAALRHAHKLRLPRGTKTVDIGASQHRIGLSDILEEASGLPTHAQREARWCVSVERALAEDGGANGHRRTHAAFWLGAPMTDILGALAAQSECDLDDLATGIIRAAPSWQDAASSSSRDDPRHNVHFIDADFFRDPVTHEPHWLHAASLQTHEPSHTLDDVRRLYERARERNEVLPPFEEHPYPVFIRLGDDVALRAEPALANFVAAWNYLLYSLAWPCPWLFDDLLRRRAASRKRRHCEMSSSSSSSI